MAVCESQEFQAPWKDMTMGSDVTITIILYIATFQSSILQ